MHGVLDVDRAILCDAAVIAGQQHRPFGERHKDRVVHLQLDRQLDRPVSRIVPCRLDVGLHLAQHRGGFVGLEPGHLEIGRQGDLQHIDLLAGRPDGLRVRAAQGQVPGLEIVPDARIGIGGFECVGLQPGDALQIRQGRHVHDRHAGHPGPRHRVEQFANPRGAVLRLLHRQRDEIVVLRVDVARAGSGELARQFSRVELDRLPSASDRQPYSGAVVVERLHLGREAHHRYLVAAEQQLCCQEGAVGSAHGQDVVSRHTAVSS